jgi:hypothetical protein
MYGNVNYYSISPNSRLRMYFVYKMFSVRKMIDKVIDLVGSRKLPASGCRLFGQKPVSKQKINTLPSH